MEPLEIQNWRKGTHCIQERREELCNLQGGTRKEEGEGKREAEVVQTWYQNIQCGETSFPLLFTNNLLSLTKFNKQLLT